MYIFFFKKRNYIVNWITKTRKSGEYSRATYGNTGQLFRLYEGSSVLYRDLPHWRSNQRPKNAEPNHRTQVTANLLRGRSRYNTADET